MYGEIIIVGIPVSVVNATVIYISLMTLKMIFSDNDSVRMIDKNSTAVLQQSVTIVAIFENFVGLRLGAKLAKRTLRVSVSIARDIA